MSQMTKAQLVAENVRQRATIDILNRKLFNINSERAKWETRARAAQSAQVTGSYAERAAIARDAAMRLGRSVAVGSV